MRFQPSKHRFPLGLVVLLLCAAPVLGQPADETGDIYERFDQVSRLRGMGDIEGSLEILEGIIAEYSDSDEVIRRAYNQLVYTLNFAERADEAREKARQALLSYPDLQADPAYVPASMNRLYDELRGEMFGALTISEPEDCRVFLNGEHRGNTPLHIPLLLAETYELEMLKSGFHAYEDTLRINPSGSHELSFSMQRDRSRSWWLKRIGVGAAAGTIAVILLSGDEDTPVEVVPEPLPGPPGTPTK